MGKKTMPLKLVRCGNRNTLHKVVSTADYKVFIVLFKSKMMLMKIRAVLTMMIGRDHDEDRD